MNKIGRKMHTLLKENYNLQGIKISFIFGAQSILITNGITINNS